jgi:hypothetical protein
MIKLIVDFADQIKLSPEQAKKFERKSKVGSGLTIQLDPYQQISSSDSKPAFWNSLLKIFLL